MISKAAFVFLFIGLLFVVGCSQGELPKEPFLETSSPIGQATEYTDDPADLYIIADEQLTLTNSPQKTNPTTVSFAGKGDFVYKYGYIATGCTGVDGCNAPYREGACCDGWQVYSFNEEIAVQRDGSITKWIRTEATADVVLPIGEVPGLDQGENYVIAYLCKHEQDERFDCDKHKKWTLLRFVLNEKIETPELCWAAHGKCDSDCQFGQSTKIKHYSSECSKTCRETHTFYQLSEQCGSNGTGECFKQISDNISATICTHKLMFPYGDFSCSGAGGDWCAEGSDYSKGINCQLYNDVISDTVQCYWIDPDEALEVKLLVLIYDPILKSSNGKRLHEVYGWQNPIDLTRFVIQDLRESSHGLVNYEIVETVVNDGFPPYKTDCSYTEESYREALKQFFEDGSTDEFCGDDNLDIGIIDATYSISERIEAGEIDEVFYWGAPGITYPGESAMAGDGAYWINAPPEDDISSSKAFVIMGLNYERGIAEALESYGHRSEWILQKMHNAGGWGGYVRHEGNAWDRFLIRDIDVPGKGGIGDIHDAVNARVGEGYDRTSPRVVLSNADEWLKYPNIDYNYRREVSCTEWGCDIEGNDHAREYQKWWYSHLPHAPGETDGKLNNWWKYIVRVDEYKNKEVPPILAPI